MKVEDVQKTTFRSCYVQNTSLEHFMIYLKLIDAYFMFTKNVLFFRENIVPFCQYQDLSKNNECYFMQTTFYKKGIMSMLRS